MNDKVLEAIYKEFPEVTNSINESLFLRGEYSNSAFDKEFYEKLLKNNPIYVYGTGQTTDELLRRIPYLNVKAFVDSFHCHEKERYLYYGEKYIPVIAPCEMEHGVYCIVSSIYYSEIKEKLEELGWSEGIDFISFQALLPTPGEMINKMLCSEKITEWKCEYYKCTKRLQRDGSVGFCMNTPWLYPANGNAFLQNFEDIKQSIRSRLIAISIEQGIYCFCNKKRCAPLRKYTGMQGKGEHREYKSAIAAFDRTCNLQCESCRSERLSQDDKKVKYLEKYFRENFIEDADIINCAGEGEALYSPAYKNIFENCRGKDKALMVLSNGNLANIGNVDKLIEISKGKLAFSISIDAAIKETYERLRIGGNYDILYENLLNIGEQVKQGKIKTLGLNYVISKKNLGEIKQFISEAKQIGADAINFTMIGNWGTFTEDEFTKIRVTDDYGNPIEELNNLMEEIKKSENDVKIYFCQEYEYRAFINNKLLGEFIHGRA